MQGFVEKAFVIAQTLFNRLDKDTGHQVGFVEALRKEGDGRQSSVDGVKEVHREMFDAAGRTTHPSQWPVRLGEAGGAIGQRASGIHCVDLAGL